ERDERAGHDASQRREQRSHGLERAAEAHEHLGRLRTGAELVAPLDAHVTDAEPPAGALQPRHRWTLPGRRVDVRGVEESQHLKRAPPTDRVFEVDQLKRVTRGFLEFIAVDGADATDRE